MADQTASTSITVTVKLFAKARDLAGTSELVLSLPAGALVSDVRQELLNRYPALDVLGPRLLAAVNAVYAQDSRELIDGAEIAFFPPVSGG